MEQGNDNLRERLLGRLPQPGNLPAYREETAALLAKHSRALRWERISTNTIIVIAMALWFFRVPNPLWHLDAGIIHGFEVASVLMFFFGVIISVRYEIYASQVATLKELKQVQLQILELQASLQKDRSPQS